MHFCYMQQFYNQTNEILKPKKRLIATFAMSKGNKANKLLKLDCKQQRLQITDSTKASNNR